jgi:predicted secreted protein
MKYITLLLLLGFHLLPAGRVLGAPPVEIRYEELAGANAAAPRQVKLRVGQELHVILRANPSTGYRWDLSPGGSPQGCLKLQHMEYRSKANPSNMPGVGGAMYCSWVAQQAGQQTLALRYHRGTNEVADRCVLNVEVRP